MTYPSPSDTRVLTVAHDSQPAMAAGAPAHRGLRGHRLARPSRDQINDVVFQLTTHATLTLSGGNAVLAALGIARLRGDRPVTFRVPATIHTDVHRPGAAVDEAWNIARSAARSMTWTRFAGCPEGYGIDPPGTDPHTGQPGTLVVHTDLYLTVTVPAYQPYHLVRTAYALLATDIQRDPDLPLRLHTDRITHVPPRGDRCTDEDDMPVDVSRWDLQHSARAIGPAPDDNSPHGG